MTTKKRNVDIKPMDLKVIRPCSTKANLTWNTVPLASTYCVTVRDAENLQGEWFFNVEGDANNIELPIPLMPGQKYQVVVRAQKMRFRSGVVVYQTIRQSSTKFRAEFTMQEQQELYNKAVSYLTQGKGNNFNPIQLLYRNKPDEYWDYISRKRAGVMEVYLKDNNGDPASVINGKVNGLFFATNIDRDTKRPPSMSHFGNRRLYIPAAVLFGDDSVCLYFADFYCNFRAHYVTVVMTTAGSNADRFCTENLIRLDLYKNPFLFKLLSEVYVTSRLYIEVLYTENVNIYEWVSQYGAYFDMVEVCTGTSTPGGLVKNPKCTICNLYPPLFDKDDEIN